MIKRETFMLMEMVAQFFEQFQLDQKKVDAWHEVLQSYPFDEAKANLVNFAASSPFPPKVADLVRKTAIISRVIPNSEDTKVILHIQGQPAKEEIVQQELSKMRKILGIKRAGDE